MREGESEVVVDYLVHAEQGCLHVHFELLHLNEHGGE